ncbi:hypothetical protein FOA52_002018 [Chlamydomonas sp. UWO 241]|nr:hypothetical protein FOA52_002018 [Chlamydomonas sp. UWO 241]
MHAVCHDVLFSLDLWTQQLWPRLDGASKVAMRGVCSAMRSQVDGSRVEAVTSPASGFSGDDLSRALVRWPRTRHLTLLNVGGSFDLAPLATSSLAGLMSLTVRQAPHAATWDMEFSAGMAATVQGIDISGCTTLSSINCVSSCVQLRCLSMRSCVSSPDLSPLGACSQTLEELWMANNDQIENLDLLKACTGLRKLDIRGLYDLYEGADDLQLTCTQLADPWSVEVEGLVQKLRPTMPIATQLAAVAELLEEVENDCGFAEFAAAGAIPALLRLLGPASSADLMAAAAGALHRMAFLAAEEAENGNFDVTEAGALPALVLLLGQNSLAGVHAPAAIAIRKLANGVQNQTAIVATGAIPPLVELLGHESSAVIAAAARALHNLSSRHAQNKAVISTAVPTLVRLLGHELSADVQMAAAGAQRSLAANHAQNQSAYANAGAIPSLVQLLGSNSLAVVQEAAAGALRDLADNHVQNQADIAAAGAIPALEQLIGPNSSLGVQAAAAGALCNIAVNHAANKTSILALVQLLAPDSSADVQVAAADALCSMAAKHAQN